MTIFYFKFEFIKLIKFEENFMTFKSTIFLVFLFSIYSLRTYSCSYAYQYSIFPLGSSAGDIIFLEVELERYVSTPAELMMYGGNLLNKSIETRWKGNLSLKKTSDGRDFTLLQTLAFVDIADELYYKELQPYFLKAMDIAREFPYFKEGILLNYANCAYDRYCNFFIMEIDSLSKLYCKEDSLTNNRIEVVFPDILVNKFETVHRLNEQEAEEQESLRKDFVKVWKPCSIRVYEISGRKISIYCIGWGQKKGYNAKKDDAFRYNHKPIEEYIEGNDVMMHGQRFDVFQLF